MKKVIIASKNPVKINATKLGFTKMFPDEKFKFVGVSVPSGVPDQPMGEKETFKGASNRLNNIYKIEPNADYWVAMEGGVKKTGKEMEDFAWMIIKSKEGKEGKGRAASFFLPKKIVDLVNKGKDLSEADEIIFGDKNSKQTNGSIGNLTDDVVTRTTYYEQAVIFALIPFKKPDLY